MVSRLLSMPVFLVCLMRVPLASSIMAARKMVSGTARLHLYNSGTFTLKKYRKMKRRKFISTTATAAGMPQLLAELIICKYYIQFFPDDFGPDCIPVSI